MNILETNRLALRRLVPEDAADLHRIYSDPETMKFMGKAPDSVEEERDHIQSHIARHYEKYGVGLWATVLKENNRLIGRCGLMRKQIDGVEEVEIAYLLDREYWGKGLATEAAEAIISHGYAKYGFKRIVAVIHPQNVASIRVVEKIGMKYERDVLYGDIGKVAVYALTVRSIHREFSNLITLPRSGREIIISKTSLKVSEPRVMPITISFLKYEWTRFSEDVE